MIRVTFLPHILFQKTKTLPPIVGALRMIPVKKSGLGVLNPVTSAQKKCLSSQRGSAELIQDVTGEGAFSNSNLLQTLVEEIRNRKKDWEAMYETKLKGLVCDLKGTNRRLILRAKITGDCMSVRVTTVSGTVLSATEFRDFLFARYNVSPLNLQSQ